MHAIVTLAQELLPYSGQLTGMHLLQEAPALCKLVSSQCRTDGSGRAWNSLLHPAHQVTQHRT